VMLLVYVGAIESVGFGFGRSAGGLYRWRREIEERRRRARASSIDRGPGGRKFMSTEVVARILKGTLRPGPRDVHTITTGQVGSSHSEAGLTAASHSISIAFACKPLGAGETSGRPVRCGHLLSAPGRHYCSGDHHPPPPRMHPGRARLRPWHASLSALTCFLTLHGLLRLTIVLARHQS
jgi:hypothetical protein